MFIQKDNQTAGKIDFKKQAEELEAFIKNNIPLAGFMNICVEELTNYSIKITAPFNWNKNHYGTVFGGSIVSLGIIAGWSLLHFRISEENINTILMIQESKMKFFQPIHNGFEAVNNSLPVEVWEEFKEEYLKNGKAKIRLLSHLYSKGELVATHEGLFTALSVQI